jgi:hypothetical protein
MSIRYDENTKARTVRLVREHREDYVSEWAAVVRRLSAVLSDRPTVLAIQTRQHAQHQARRVAQRLVAGKTRRDPIDARTLRSRADDLAGQPNIGLP